MKFIKKQKSKNFFLTPFFFLIFFFVLILLDGRNIFAATNPPGTDCSNPSSISHLSAKQVNGSVLLSAIFKEPATCGQSIDRAEFEIGKIDGGKNKVSAVGSYDSSAKTYTYSLALSQSEAAEYMAKDSSKIKFGLIVYYSYVDGFQVSSGIISVDIGKASTPAPAPAPAPDTKVPDNTADPKKNPTTPAGNTTEFINPITATTLSGVLSLLLSNLMGIASFIAIIFILVGGIMYIMSAGDDTRMEKAKSIVTAAVIGLAIILAAPVFLKEIETILGGNGGATADDIVGKAPTIKDIVLRILNLLLSVVGIIGIIGLIVGGIFYLTSYGDDTRMEKGKAIITASIIGIVISFGALVIVQQVANLLKIG